MVQKFSKSDENIAYKIQRGETELFSILVERYQKKLLRYANKFLRNKRDAEDAVQEVFLKGYQNIQSFNTKKRFSPWIYRIAHNAFINIIKKKKREKIFFYDLDTILPHFIKVNSHEEEISDKFDRGILEKILKKMAPKYREIVYLYYFEERDYSEIADILQIPTPTVGVRLKRARQKIKQIYHNKYE